MYGSAARSGRLRQIHLKNRHVEVIRDVTLVVVLVNQSYEFAANMHFDGILLLPLDESDGVESEQIPQIFFQTPDFAAGQSEILLMRLLGKGTG
jgi:hypothetical protein